MFKIKTPNPQFNGVREGLHFVGGVAYTEDTVLCGVLVSNYGYLSEESKVKPEEPKKDAEPVEVSAKPAPKPRAKTSGK
ncbi:hypothetical protein [Paenibacillus vini]|uniref:hypothetical protein n=1 Tax=Paenibacillus vini TaxID=1476024 RepID=UPI001BCD15B8|nr:hypothetical protein [Paenibacillus vini]